MSAPISVNYENVKQEFDCWCWAAVAANVFNSILPPAEPFSPTGKKLHQCDVATKVNLSCNSSRRRLFSLVVALDSWMTAASGPSLGLGILQTAFDANDVNLFNHISDELTGTSTRPGEPVCAEVEFAQHPGTLTHFVTVTGCDPTTRNVWVADPFLGGESVEYTLDAFLHRYSFGRLTGGVVQAVYAVHR
jgi:hypothetical protein